MHLRSRYLPKPSASSPPDNRAHPMANPGQILDLEGLHREIHGMAEQMRIMNENNGRLMQLLAAANPPLLAAPPVNEIERYRHSNRLGDRSQNISTERVRGRRRAPSPSLRERSFSSESSKTPARVRRGRSPHRGDHIKARNKSTSQKIRDLDARLDAINTGTNAPAILEVEDPSDKIIIMAMMEGLRPGPLFDSLSKDVPETLSALQSKADKYIAAEELARPNEGDEEKMIIRGKSQLRGGSTIERKQGIKDLTDILNALTIGVLALHLAAPNLFYRHSTPPLPKGYLRKYIVTRPPPNSPERRYGNNRPTAGDIQIIHGGFESGGYSTSSTKKHARSAFRPAEEEIYNLSSSYVGDQTPITFSNDDLRGLHLPHDDALVVSAIIANFNVQRILIDNGSSADILFILAFKRMKIGLDKLHPFHTP
ncbi:hypothetical protein Acr_00g0017880 [Actinidia rufa]|uniref:Uncharacterized protein n=1 Tax=Actinidia rufa TaxID=165716 RepID=A0A7J0DBK7_9ERIC|nr:hypothetical protein Acr_00g0017880 [Actinidia rufa]